MKKLFLFALVATSLSACKKDSENSPSKTDLLTSKKWRVTALTETSTTTVAGGTPTTTTTDLYATLRACDKDDFTQFYTNKTVVDDEGATKCNTSNPQTMTSTWDLPGDQTKLVTTNASVGVRTQEILELTASTLRLRDTYSNTSGGTTYAGKVDVTLTSF